MQDNELPEMSKEKIDNLTKNPEAFRLWVIQTLSNIESIQLKRLEKKIDDIEEKLDSE